MHTSAPLPGDNSEATAAALVETLSFDSPKGRWNLFDWGLNGTWWGRGQKVRKIYTTQNPIDLSAKEISIENEQELRQLV